MFDPHHDDHRVDTLQVLRTHYRNAHPGTIGKERAQLDEATAMVAARCRFAAIGTFDADGNADVSPRGGPSGFIRVLSPTHLAMADLGGNNRLDTLMNIVATGKVALLMITPGQTETVRIKRVGARQHQPGVAGAIAACRFSSIEPRNSCVVCHGCSGLMSRARSLVIFPLSTVSMQTRSRVCANSLTSGVPSSLPRC
jgi:predicted pyridoxine 5'-phosphate oxidase superfamily flavin-nucleotide-binding protein